MSRTKHHRDRRFKWKAPRWFTNMILRGPERTADRIALAHYCRGGEEPVLRDRNKPNADWDWL